MIGSGGQGQQERGNVGLAVLAGLVVAIACSLGWGVIAYVTKYQFSIMAILVGLAIGTVMARVGGTRNVGLGIAGAVLAVFGCALGSLVAEILLLLRHSVPISEILAHLDLVVRFYPSAVGGLGFLFWAIAAFYGYRIAMGMRSGFPRRRPRTQPPGQPYGMPYGAGPYGAGPGQPVTGAGAVPPGPVPPGQVPASDQAAPPPATPGPAEPVFGFKEPPPDFGSPQQPAP